MPNNNLLPKENYKKVEIVQELKNEYQVPSFEEFMENYEFDERIVESYEEEAKAQAFQGPKCGPGRSDFSGLCRRIKNDLGDNNLTCRITCDSDNFYSWKNYAGVIIYAVDGNFRWVFSNNRIGRSFSMIIKSTDGWGNDRMIGGSLFHGSIIKDELGVDIGYNRNAVCCGGFTYRNGELKFDSHALNSVNQIGCSSDGSSELSYYEKRLVEYCFNEYKANGPGSMISIPSYYLP